MKFLILQNDISKNTRTASNGLVDIYKEINESTSKIPRRFDFVHTPILTNIEGFLNKKANTNKINSTALKNTFCTGDNLCFDNIDSSYIEKIRKALELLDMSEHDAINIINNNSNGFYGYIEDYVASNNDIRLNILKLNSAIHDLNTESIAGSNKTKTDHLAARFEHFRGYHNRFNDFISILPVLEVLEKDIVFIKNNIQVSIIKSFINNLFEPNVTIYNLLGLSANYNRFCEKDSYIHSLYDKLRKNEEYDASLNALKLTILKLADIDSSNELANKVVDYVFNIDNFVDIVNIDTTKSLQDVFNDIKTLFKLDTSYLDAVPLELLVYNLPEVKKYIDSVKEKTAAAKEYIDKFLLDYSLVKLTILMNGIENDTSKQNVTTTDLAVKEPVVEVVTEQERAVVQQDYGILSRLNSEESIESTRRRRHNFTVESLNQYLNLETTNTALGYSHGFSEAA